MDGGIDGWEGGRLVGSMGGWTSGWVGNEWVDGGTIRWADGWMHVCMYVCIYAYMRMHVHTCIYNNDWKIK